MLNPSWDASQPNDATSKKIEKKMKKMRVNKKKKKKKKGLIRRRLIMKIKNR
jgi:hypothetical protein